MKVDIAGIGMIDDTPVEEVWALMRPDNRLRMDSGMNGCKVIDSIAQDFFHLF